MNTINTLCKTFVLTLIAITIGFTANSQTSSDSLTLTNIIKKVMENHPAVKSAAENINAANAGIGLAKTAYLPIIDGTASYARLGPVQELTFPGFGTFQLFPADNYNASINAYESVYDFGRTAKNIAMAKEVKNLHQETLEQVKQKLAYSATLVYYSIVYLQKAILINLEQQKTLNEHLQFVQKKQESGTGIQYEILSTQVKISNVESAGIDLHTALSNQLSELNSLMGQDASTAFAVKQQLDASPPAMPADSMLAFAFSHRDELKLAQQKTTMAELKYKIVKLQNNPTLNLQLSGGAKNGYIPDLNMPKANFVASIGLKVPIFDGLRSKYTKLQAKSNITITDYDTELAKRTIANELAQNQENIKASLRKIAHYTLQMSQSEEAYRLAQANFKAGSITNMDILDAATTISESSLLLFKARIEYITNLYKLKLALGERLY